MVDNTVMALLRLVAEKIGPFEERLDLDFSDGAGNPHLGPHILAGVNGSGKSTALRTIAWVIAEEGDGFDFEDWTHMLRGPGSQACCLFKGPEGQLFQQAVCVTGSEGGPENWMGLFARNGGRAEGVNTTFGLFRETPEDWPFEIRAFNRNLR